MKQLSPNLKLFNLVKTFHLHEQLQTFIFNDCIVIIMNLVFDLDIAM